MNTALAILASMISVLALYLPTRTQTFTWADVDGRKIRMLVAGRGDPTVVFQNGLGGPLENWGKVQPSVSRFARTVSYDRAGVGRSDEGPLPRDGRRIAAELRQALQSAGIGPPYILVGASLGGPYIRVYAGMYPEDVAAMVLVDPTPQSETVDGIARLPEHKSMPETLAQAGTSRIPVNVAVFLIDARSLHDVPFATESIRALRLRHRADLEAESAEYKEWLDAIPGSRLIPVTSGHNVAQEQPGIVVATIREAVDEVRRVTSRR